MPDTNDYVDLHLHTNQSDGSDSPTRVVERAIEKTLNAIAITDHDTLSGLTEAAAAAEASNLSFLPGTEVSAQCDGSELHILGLGVRSDSPELQEGLQTLRQRRADRAVEIVALLNDVGVPVQLEKIEARTAAGLIGRMHIALEILELGHARSVQDAFDKFIKKGRPAFVRKDAMPCEEAIERIHAAGGLAFIAHPGIGAQSKRFARLFSFPFDGLEVYHTRHSPDQVKAFEAIVSERGMLASGGSDCHGNVKGEKPLMGGVRVPQDIYLRICDALAAR